MIDGWYYLHSETKDLIWKKFWPGEDNSPFVQKIWALDKSDRLCAWTIVLEALALGLKIDRAKELAKKWGLTYGDSIEMMIRAGKPTRKMHKGMRIFIEQILGLEYDVYFDVNILEAEGEEGQCPTP